MAQRSLITCRRILIARLLSTACALVLLGTLGLHAQPLNTYLFTDGTGTPFDMTGATTIFSTGIDDAVSGVQPIGFTFLLQGNPYTQFSASSNGYIGLGPSPATSWLSGSFSSTNFGVPVVAALWRDLHTGNDGSVTYRTTGSVGSRILTVEWKIRDYPGSGQPTTGRMQIRLYEGTNKIEIWYGPIATAGGTVGVQVNTSTFASITPGAPATVSNAVSNNSVAPPGGINKVYSFAPCTIVLNGNVPQGGTLAMANLDTLLVPVTGMLQVPTQFMPFVVFPSSCTGASTVSYTISGPSAADYSISPVSTPIAPNGSSTPTITFTAQALGRRPATLTVNGPYGFTRSYTLYARGRPTLDYIGNIPQGGTVGMNDGDVLLSNIAVRRGTTTLLQPFLVRNVNPIVESSPLDVTYTLKGTSSGQYQLNTSGVTLAAGQSNTPTITFHPTQLGTIVDTLVVVGSGETRTFPLAAQSRVPAINFIVDGQPADTNLQLFRNVFTCEGSTLAVLPVQVTNTGNGSLDILGIDVYQVDTNYTQGQPRYRLIPEGEGFRRMSDYIITDVAPVLPLSANRTIYPISVSDGQTRMLYLVFNAQRIDKRFARIFIRTNAENITNFNERGVAELGLIRLDLFGRGVGGRLGERGAAYPTKPVIFPETSLDTISEMPFTLQNSGECDLRVVLKRMEIVAGDVDEFKIVTMPTGNIDAVTGDLVLAPGASATGSIQFHPSHNGSRRASMRVPTNDSMVAVNGITERGSYYFDLYGTGKASLYAQGADLGTALIAGTTAADRGHGVVRLRNTVNAPIRIAGLSIGGPDAADYTPDPAHPWPSGAVILKAGQQLELAVEFAPLAPGAAQRTAYVKFALDGTDSVIAPLTGIAGTRTIQANPSALNFSVSAGKEARQMVSITNTGTLQLTIGKYEIAGNPDYSLSTLPRLVLDPGQVELLEVTFAPQSAGTSNATLTIESNASNNTQNVAINGVAATKKRRADDPSSATTSADRVNGTRLGAASEAFSLSGVTGVANENGMALFESVPNPGRDVVEIAWALPARGPMELALYDGTGRLVRVLTSGIAEAGQGHTRVDVGGLANGVYHYRMIFGGRTLSRSLTVVR